MLRAEFPNLAQFAVDSPYYQSRTSTGKVVLKRKGKRKKSIFDNKLLQGTVAGAGLVVGGSTLANVAKEMGQEYTNAPVQRRPIVARRNALAVGGGVGLAAVLGGATAGGYLLWKNRNNQKT
jgi:hypothetical protein